MNQDQIKAALLRLESDIPDFSVILSGKKSNKVDGLYKPDTKEIVIHNRNFTSNNELIYTAVHEFAHHLQFSRALKPISSRCHTSEFWSIFHVLLKKAEDTRLYENIFITNEEFLGLTHTIKTEFLAKNGAIMKELGKLLVRAKELCDKYKASFYDYIERVLCLERSSARSIIKTFTYDIRPEMGFDNMKAVARIANEQKRREAQEAILDGASPYIVKTSFMEPGKSNPSSSESNKIEALKKEKADIEKRICVLQKKLAEVKKRILEVEKE